MSNTVAPVYVVDDDASVRQAVGSLIRSARLSVETFASAQELLASPRAKVPSCLVLDVQLPGLSGLDLQQELVKTEAQVPIIFLSGHGDIPTTVRAMKAGALEFLTKPFDDDVLLDAIHQAIARHPSPAAAGVESPPVPKRKPSAHPIPVGDTRIRVLCVGGNPMLLAGIDAFLGTQPDMQMVGHATNAQDGIQQFRELEPDVTLMDLRLPDMCGIDAISAIRENYPEARLIILATYSGDGQALRALKAGARAYLLKDTLHEELLKTIRAVHAGKKTVSPEVSFQLAEHATNDALTPAEIRVLRLIAEGNANKEIAARLSVSAESVKGRVKSILSKMGANDRTHAAMIGLRRGIIEI